MVDKAGDTALIPEEKMAFLREILGIVLALLAVLAFLSIASANQVSNWVGPVGEWISFRLILVLGEYVCYILPVMLFILAYHALRGESAVPMRLRSWLRGLGGLLILVSTCSLLALTVEPDAPLARDLMYIRGGTIGSIIIHPDGLDLSRHLGRVGSPLIFGGLALIGLVLFTERLLREIFGLIWGGFRQGGGSVSRLRIFDRLHLGMPSWLHLLGKPFEYLPLLWTVPGRVRSYLQGVDFNRKNEHRVIPVGPILEVKSAHEEAGKTDGEEGHLPGGVPFRLIGGRQGTTRSGTVFPRDTTPSAPQAPVPAQSFRPVAPRQAPFQATRPKVSESPQVGASEHTPGIAMENPIQDRPDLEGQAREHVIAVQDEMELFPSEYQLPPLDLLADPPSTLYVMSDEDKARLSRQIEQTLAQFKVEVEVVEVVQGPVITRFALRLAPGVRVNKIQALESELAMALKAQSVRILAPIPGQAAVGIEVPNKRANPVLLKELLACDAFQKSRSPLTFALGKNIAGEPNICDLAKMPHLLIAGATGSGKSVCLNTIIASLLIRNKPDRIKFVMIDPKRVELSIYQAIPHLIAPVVSEARKAAAALAWCVEQMEERYKILAEIGVRNLDGYNAVLNDRQPNKKSMGRDLKFMPHIVIIIDELADLMMVAKNEVEEYIIRLAQMARAVGMHLILATQRPSVNVITGVIKANFPSRIAFQVSSKVDSRTILEMNGAEALMGKGDMLYSPGGVKPFRLQGAFVADAEVERLSDFIREQEKARYEKEDFELKPTPAERAKAQILDDEDHLLDDNGLDLADGPGTMATKGRAGMAPLSPSDIDSFTDDQLYDMALRLILESRKASVSYIQRRLKIGYARAGRIMDMLEDQAIVGPYQGSKPRDLIVDPDECLARLNGEAEASIQGPA